MKNAKRALLSLVTAAVLVMSVGVSSPAQADPVYYYEIVAQHSGKCLDVAYASQAHAANVVQATCWSGTNQQWSRVPTDSGYFRLVARHSGKCLDVYNAGYAHGTNVVQGDCWSPGYNQQWKFVDVYGPTWPYTGTPFTLVARHSGLCLDVQNASQAHAANVLQASCWNGANQIWRLKTPGHD